MLKKIYFPCNLFLRVALSRSICLILFTSFLQASVYETWFSAYNPLSRMNRNYCIINTNQTYIHTSADKSYPFPSPSNCCLFIILCFCLCVLLHEKIEIDLRHSSHINQEDITTNRICCNMHAFGLWVTNVQSIMVSSTVLV